MWYIILNVLLLIPPVIASVKAVISLKGVCAKERKVILAFFVPTLIAYFSIQTFLVSEGYYPFWGSWLLHHLAATLMLPMAYMMIRKSLDVTSGRRVLTVLLALLVLLVPDVCLQLSTPFDAEPMTAMVQNNYVSFNIAPGMRIKHSLYAFIVDLQVVIVITRVLEMRSILIQRDLYLSENGRTFVYTCLACCVWIIFSVVPSQLWLQSHHVAMLLINLVYSTFVTVIVTMIGKYFNESVVMNSENELVNIENDIDSDLAEGLRLAIERDQVYRHSALRIEELAMMLSTNRTYVARVCRLKFGKTFTELMNLHRVAHSKELMANNLHMRMEDVAAESGFSSASFFAKVFKNHEGCTPTQWRLSVSQKKAGMVLAKQSESQEEVNEASRGGGVSEWFCASSECFDAESESFPAPEPPHPKRRRPRKRHKE